MTAPYVPGPDHIPTRLQDPPPPRRSVMPWLIAAAALVLAAAGVGAYFILRADPAPASATPEPAPASAAVAAAGKPAPDTYAQEACGLVWRVFEEGRITTGEVLSIEEPAGKTVDANVREAGAEVIEKFKTLLVSRALEDGDEALLETELTTAVVTMNTVCIEAGVQVG